MVPILLIPRIPQLYKQRAFVSQPGLGKLISISRKASEKDRWYCLVQPLRFITNCILRLLDDVEYDPSQPTDELNIPHGFTAIETENSYHIEHFRTGMGCLNLFLVVWIVGWIIGILTIVIPFEGITVKTSGYFVCLALAVLALISSLFTKKSFCLTESSLCIETRLWFLRWHLTLTRETITHLIQVQDGGKGRDSFPSWGLKVKSASDGRGLLERIMSFAYLGRNVRYRSLLYRLPYEHSYWLGIVVARWAEARLDLCSRPRRSDSLFGPG